MNSEALIGIALGITSPWEISSVEIELAEVNTHDGYRIVEDNAFVDLGCRHSKRFCRLISGLCCHMIFQPYPNTLASQTMLNTS